MISTVSKELNDYVDYLVFGDEGQSHPFRQSTITVNLQGLKDHSEMYRSAIRALDAWEVTTGLRFTLSTSAKANIVVDNEVWGEAYAQSTYDSSEYTTSVFINIGADWMDGFPVSEQWGYGSYGLQTFIHEFGHALGLNHGGPYNGEGTYDWDAIFNIDTYQFSVMSYFTQSDYWKSEASDLYLSSPMIADILGIKEIYGNLAINAGNTVYGKGAATELAFTNLANYPTAGNDVPNAAFTIRDTGGVDRIDFSNASAACVIDLRPGSFSDINGYQDNVTIALGTIIENCIGSVFSDTVHGNGVGNNVRGGSGNDVLNGYKGWDKLFGQAGNDFLYGGAGNDVLNGGAGNDRLFGGAGNDRLTGGAGKDVFVFAKGAGADTITDFQDGVDRIQINIPSVKFADVSISDATDGALVAVGGIRIMLSGIDATQLTQADFVF